MKEETIVDLEIRGRCGDKQIILDRLKGLTPNIAAELLVTKYTTKKRKNEDKKLLKIL